MIRFMMFIKEGQGKVPRITQGKSISVIPNTADAAKEGAQFSGCTWAETDQPTMTEIARNPLSVYRGWRDARTAAEG